MSNNCIPEIIQSRQRTGSCMESAHNNTNIRNHSRSLQNQCNKWADPSILDGSSTFILNLQHFNFPNTALYIALPAHYDDGAPNQLLKMWAMAGEPDLTPAPAVYSCDGEDVAWTRNFGMYRQLW